MQIGRIECDFLKGFKIRTNYVSISYCNLEQVTPSKYPNQKYVYIYIYIYIRNDANIACQLLHQSQW